MLVASALLMLSVMSAIVAFNGFPGQAIQDPIGSVPVEQAQAPLAVQHHPAPSTASRSARSASAAHAGRSSHHSRSGHARSPLAHATPVVHRQSAAGQPTRSGSGTPALPDPGSLTSGVTQTLPSAPTVPPSGVGVPSSPVTLPDSKQLPVSLPVDTSAVTGAVTTTSSGLLGGQ
jgi:hypothetical protein